MTRSTVIKYCRSGEICQVISIRKIFKLKDLAKMIIIIALPSSKLTIREFKT